MNMKTVNIIMAKIGIFIDVGLGWLDLRAEVTSDLGSIYSS